MTLATLQDIAITFGHSYIQDLTHISSAIVLLEHRTYSLLARKRNCRAKTKKNQTRPGYQPSKRLFAIKNQQVFQSK